MQKNNAKAKKASAENVERKIVLHPTVLVLGTYILLLLSKIIDVTLINRDNEYLSVVVLQMMIFLIPAALWCRFSGERYIRSLRIAPIKASSITVIVAAAALMISGGVLISMIFGGLESLSQNFSLYNTFISKDDGTAPSRLYLVLAYAVLPALCEEFVYRGILCHEYEKGGVTRAVLISSLFFSLLHFNLQNFPVYFFAGVILALTLYATRSVFGAIIAHFLYNLFGLFGQPYINTFYNITSSTRLFVFIIVMLFLVSAIIFCAEASRLYKRYFEGALSSKYREPALQGFESIKASYIEVLTKPSAIACYALYIVALIVLWL